MMSIRTPSKSKSNRIANNNHRQHRDTTLVRFSSSGMGRPPLSAARTRGLRASTGGGDASRGVAMAGRKKVKAKRPPERPTNGSRAGNGSDPTSPGGDGSSRPPIPGGIAQRLDEALSEELIDIVSTDGGYTWDGLKELVPTLLDRLVNVDGVPDDLEGGRPPPCSEP